MDHEAHSSAQGLLRPRRGTRDALRDEVVEVDDLEVWYRSEASIVRHEGRGARIARTRKVHRVFQANPERFSDPCRVLGRRPIKAHDTDQQVSERVGGEFERCGVSSARGSHQDIDEPDGRKNRLCGSGLDRVNEPGCGVGEWPVRLEEVDQDVAVQPDPAVPGLARATPLPALRLAALPLVEREVDELSLTIGEPTEGQYDVPLVVGRQIKFGAIRQCATIVRSAVVGQDRFLHQLDSQPLLSG